MAADLKAIAAAALVLFEEAELLFPDYPIFPGVTLEHLQSAFDSWVADQIEGGDDIIMTLQERSVHWSGERINGLVSGNEKPSQEELTEFYYSDNDFDPPSAIRFPLMEGERVLGWALIEENGGLAPEYSLVETFESEEQMEAYITRNYLCG